MKTKKHLYWLHSHFLFSTGGTRFIFEVIALLAQKYTVTVLVEKSSVEWKEKYQKIGVDVREISDVSSTSLLYWAFLPYYLVRSYLTLKKEILPNSIVISSMFPMHILAPLLSSSTIYYCFEPFAPFYDQTFVNSFAGLRKICLQILSFFYIPLDRWAAKTNAFLLNINPSVGRSVEKIYGRKPDGYTYLGVDIDHFSFVKKSHKVSKKVRLFHSTDFTHLKGTPFLLEAMVRIVKETTHVYLQISETLPNEVVKKTYQDFVKHNHLNEFVTFLGSVPYAQLPELYQKADIYCFVGDPSSTGATAASLSVLEAEAAGVPVIRSIGNDDEVVDGETGLLVDPRDPQELADAILRLAHDPLLRSKMGSAGHQHILKRYTWKNVAATFIKYIEKV